MPLGIPPSNKSQDPPPTKDELLGLRRTTAFRTFGTAYQQIQGSKPQTLAYGLTDSPIGLLAWIAEKFRAWTDPATPISKDEMLTNVMIYWCSGCVAPSLRYYMENGTGALQNLSHFATAVHTHLLPFPSLFGLDSTD